MSIMGNGEQHEYGWPERGG